MKATDADKQEAIEYGIWEYYSRISQFLEEELEYRTAESIANRAHDALTAMLPSVDDTILVEDVIDYWLSYQ